MITSPALSEPTAIFSLEDWLENPPEHQEWVDGHLLEKNGMTFKHSNAQGNLYFWWRNYNSENGLGGKVYVEASCRTNKQGRIPDVAYLTPDLRAQYIDAKVLPQSFPLSAEIVSPTDLAEAVISKAQEYLESGGQEVWLVFPESRWVIVVTASNRQVFVSGEVVCTQSVLLGFSIAVNELFS